MNPDLEILIDDPDGSSITDFNDIPVEYCTKCLSLRIINYQGRVKSYCDECGSTDTNKGHIDDWEKLYKQKYGKAFMPRKSINKY